MLNPASPVPLYQQLAEQLRLRMACGDLAPGARLPSEPELARTHGIGRPTVRQATELLVQRGLIERRRGSGTYVRKAPARVDLFSLAGTLVSFQSGGLTLSTKLVRRVTRRPVEPDPANPFGGREAFSFTRLGSVAGKPVLFEQLYLDPEVFPGFAQIQLAGASLSRIAEEQYYLKPSHAEQSFQVALPKPEVKQALALPARASVLLVKRTLFFPSAPRAIFCELYCRTDELIFSQTIGAMPPHD